MQRQIHAMLGVLMFAVAAGAVAQKPIVYPAKGQSAEKQSKDDAECYAWAKKSTGIDPAQVAAAAPPPSGPSGERAKGAVRGAVGGAAIGAIAGDTGKGAGIGAVAGTMAGGHRTRKNEAAKNQQAQGQQQAIGEYYRAYGACMSGRGYTVS